MLSFTGETPTDYHVGIQICLSELTISLSFTKLILNSKLPNTLDRLKVASTIGRVTCTDHNLRIEILQTRGFCLFLMCEIDWVTDGTSA